MDVEWGLDPGYRTLNRVYCPKCGVSGEHYAKYHQMGHNKEKLGEYHYLECTKCNTRHTFCFIRA